jgi:hypothetical protein
VRGYDPARRTFYARLHFAAGIRDLGSAEEPIGTIGELVDQLTDVTSASWSEVERWMDTALGQERTLVELPPASSHRLACDNPTGYPLG